jgi:endonuclease-8
VPEGDTVWNTARVLHRALAGRRLVASDFRVPQLATTDLAGWTVLESVSRGKHLLLRLDAAQAGAEPLTLHSHLRMDGAWRAYANGQRWAARPAHLIRVVLRTDDHVVVGYHLHELKLVPTAAESTVVGHLGPDLLGPDWDQAEAVRRLRERADRMVGDALLDQRNLAGIGNLYKAETLFLRGVSPWTPVSDVPDLDGLVALAQRLLKANLGRWNQSTTGSLRRGEEVYVFERAGKRCRRCGTPIRRATQGDRAGYERISYWCPTCQPGPAPPGVTRPTLAHD